MIQNLKVYFPFIANTEFLLYIHISKKIPIKVYIQKTDFIRFIKLYRDNKVVKKCKSCYTTIRLFCCITIKNEEDNLLNKKRLSSS